MLRISAEIHPSRSPSRRTGRERLPSSIAQVANQNRSGWVNPKAFTCPGYSAWTVGTPCTTGSGAGPVPLPIGRFGDAQVGLIEGPSYWNLNSGLVKTFSLTSKVKLSAEGTFTNVLNHVNLNQPNLNLSTVSFGSITSGLAPRVGQVSMRLEFFSLSKGLVRFVGSVKTTSHRS